MTVQTTTLDNGIQIVTNNFPDSPVTHFQWSLIGGSLAKQPHQHGVAHFLEHIMVDRKRLANPVEQAGGDINAFTSPTHISMHATVLKRFETQTLNGVFHHGLNDPKFTEADFNREFGPIMQEVTQRLSNPNARLHLKTNLVMHAGEPLGHLGTGTHAELNTHTFDKVRDYFNQVRCSRGVVVLAAGQIDHDRFVSKVETSLGGWPDQPAIEIKPSFFHSGELRLVEPPSRADMAESEQAVLISARFNSVADSSPQAVAYRVLANMLSGGLESPLMKHLRDKHGLVYGIGAFANSWRDDGCVMFNLTTCKPDAQRAVVELTKCIARLPDLLTKQHFIRSRNSLEFRIAAHPWTPESWANDALHSMYIRGYPRSIEEIKAEFDRVTLADVKEAAHQLRTTSPFVSALGPVEGLALKEPFDQALSKFYKPQAGLV